MSIYEDIVHIKGKVDEYTDHIKSHFGDISTDEIHEAIKKVKEHDAISAAESLIRHIKTFTETAEKAKRLAEEREREKDSE